MMTKELNGPHGPKELLMVFPQSNTKYNTQAILQ